MSDLTLLWHDYETWGIDPRRDRPVQFAAIRTNADLHEMGEPVMLYCRPTDDYLPHPEAVFVTGITPQRAVKKGVNEADFFAQINTVFSQPGTCGVGYNTIRFDDEVTRFGFYRNFIDPYAREWQNGNSRWDILDLLRMAHALRPDGIQWPKNEDGSTSFRLELLTAENGIAHEGAHDALADVRATIEMAKLIKKHQPRLYDYYFKLRRKDEVARVLNLKTKDIILHISGMYPAIKGCIAPVMPLLQHPVNKNEIIVFDLRQNPEALLSLDADALVANLFTRTADLPEGEERIGLKGVHLNKSPAIAPVNTLSDEMAGRWGFDWDQIKQHRQRILSDNNLLIKLQKMYQRQADREREPSDADSALYEGFISNEDRRLCNQVLQKSPEQLAVWKPAFKDPRLQTLYGRYLARNWPELLDEQAQQQWRSFCEARLVDGEFGCNLTIQEYLEKVEAMLTQELSTRQQDLLKSLLEWVR